MKRTTTLTLASLCIACAGFAQQTTIEQTKIDRIKNDPATYQNNGGVIDSDQLIIQPEKSEKVVDPDGMFVIYKSASKETDEIKNYMKVKDQNSEEYRLLKEKYLRSNPAPQPPAEESTPRSAEERNKIYNKK